MRREVAAILVAVCCLPAAAFASEAVTQGTIELSGATSVLMNKQTLTPSDSNGNTAGTDVDLSSTVIGVSVVYYMTPRLGIGGTVNYQKMTMAQGGTTTSDIAGGTFGGVLKYRVPLGGRADFVLSGSGGANQVKINPSSGGPDSTGYFWLGGGAVSVVVTPSSTFDIGVSYQHSKFNSGNGGGSMSASGLIAGVGFSLYFNNH